MTRSVLTSIDGESEGLFVVRDSTSRHRPGNARTSPGWWSSRACPRLWIRMRGMPLDAAKAGRLS